MGKMSKDKGKVGEREVAELIRSYGFEARRGQQNRGGPGTPDVIHSIPGLHVEVKRKERFNLYEALDQAHDDAGAAEMAVVFHRRNKKHWVVALDAHDFLRMMRKIPLVNEAGDNYSMWTLPEEIKT